MFRSKLQICFFLNHPIVLCYKVPIPPSRLRRATVPQCGIVNPRLRTVLAFSGPVLRGCALRFAPCARHFSPSGLRRSQAHSRLSLPYWGLRTGLRFAGPVFRGCGALRAVLNSAWSSHCARKLASGAPCFIGLTTACFAHCARPPCAPRPFTPSGLRRLRPVSATGGGLRAPLLNPSVAATPRHLPFKKGGITGGIGQCYFLRLCHYPKGSFV